MGGCGSGPLGRLSRSQIIRRGPIPRFHLYLLTGFFSFDPAESEAFRLRLRPLTTSTPSFLGLWYLEKRIESSLDKFEYKTGKHVTQFYCKLEEGNCSFRTWSLK